MKLFWSAVVCLFVVGGLVMPIPSSFGASLLSETDLDAVGAMGETGDAQLSQETLEQLSDLDFKDIEASGIPVEIWPFQIILRGPFLNAIPTPLPRSSEKRTIIKSFRDVLPFLLPVESGSNRPTFVTRPITEPPAITR